MDRWNYFTYFTEIEEYFWKKRGAHLLVSPLDWAIMETWQKAQIPLAAVFKGIDRAFESYGRSRRGAGKPLKSLAYCTDAVLEAAEESAQAAAGQAQSGEPARRAEPFPRDELRAYISRNADLLRTAMGACSENSGLVRTLQETVSSLQTCSVLVESSGSIDVEDLERRLTVLDERLHAALLLYAGDDRMLRLRREMDAALATYRRRMKAEQLALVEKQYLQKRLLEEFRIPRLSLFYLG